MQHYACCCVRFDGLDRILRGASQSRIPILHSLVFLTVNPTVSLACFCNEVLRALRYSFEKLTSCDLTSFLTSPSFDLRDC